MIKSFSNTEKMITKDISNALKIEKMILIMNQMTFESFYAQKFK